MFDASRLPTRIAAEIRNWDISEIGDDMLMSQYRGRHSRFAAGAATQAVRDSGILDLARSHAVRGLPGKPARAIRTSIPSRGWLSPAFRAKRSTWPASSNAASKRSTPMVELEQEPNLPAGLIAAMFNAQGPNFNCLTACAASSQAVGEATEIIRRGDADVMLSGGAHSMIHPFGVTGFNLLTALSTNNDDPTKASRPFDRLRDGFVLGEGAAIVVLEELEHARRRGARIYGEILGYGSTADAYRITDIHPEGRGAIGCMRMALRDAQLDPSAVHYVNAHGTSTTVNDAWKRWPANRCSANAPRTRPCRARRA